MSLTIQGSRVVSVRSLRNIGNQEFVRIRRYVFSFSQERTQFDKICPCVCHSFSSNAQMFLGLQALWKDHVCACLYIRSCLQCTIWRGGIEIPQQDLAKLFFGKTLSGINAINAINGINGINGINWDSCSFHSSVKAFTWPEQKNEQAFCWSQCHFEFKSWT